ncbi:Di-glucose binding protein with Kinesin motor domain [Prunus dulcis]|uniref:Di-glucose binding protein with Kinesin motor domain n=1 Tax=Prunus dulcis TaxID=3755 RepID=A0A4Y1RPR9_PRUDU|nr:Di-glucose binding protein with Kinesin motor domain [Prunus dulcis]
MREEKGLCKGGWSSCDKIEGVNGSPVVSGIGIRRAPNVSVPKLVVEHFKCNNCDAEIEVPSAQMKLMQTKSTAKYEKKIQELTTQCQLKTKECYEAWMSLTAAMRSWTRS